MDCLGFCKGRVFEKREKGVINRTVRRVFYIDEVGERRRVKEVLVVLDMVKGIEGSKRRSY